MKQIKTIKGLASAIAKKEGKKSQARIGDIREILSILSDIHYYSISSGKGYTVGMILYDNGAKRSKKKAKSCRK